MSTFFLISRARIGRFTSLSAAFFCRAVLIATIVWGIIVTIITAPEDVHS